MLEISLYNFHSHTYRCGHANDDIEDYVLAAIKEGFLYYGISDHVMFPDLDQKGIRGNYQNDYSTYLYMYHEMKEKYQKNIHLYLGFEVEYSKPYISYYRSLLEGEFDYLILGQHFHILDDRIIHSYREYFNAADLYVEDMIKGMETGLILYVAHPDLVTYFHNKPDRKMKQLCLKMIKAAKRTNTPLELNVSKVEINRLAGIRNAKEEAIFPLDMFWELAGKEQVDVVIGLDCHDPKYVNQEGFQFALEYAEKYKLKVMTYEEVTTRMKLIKEKLK